MEKEKPIDVLIVGAGPAGLAAGIYAARAGLSAVLLEEAGVGGQLASIDKLENYPGFPEGANGFEVAFALKQQAEHFGASIENDKALAVSRSDQESGGFFLVQGLGELYKARSIIVAAGAKPVPLPVEGSENLVGKGLSYCATCDGNFFRGKDVAVVGGGDSAAADVIYLSRIANTVHLVHRRDALRASPWYQQRLRDLGNLAIHWNSTVQGLQVQDGRVSGLVMEDVATGSRRELSVQGVFAAIGTQPDTAWLSGFLDLDPKGYIVAHEGGATSQPGVFAAGDVRTTPLRQVVTAVSDGALAAEQAASFLAS